MSNDRADATATRATSALRTEAIPPMRWLLIIATSDTSPQWIYQGF